MTGDVRVEMSSVGPVVRPPGPRDPAGVVILYLHGDRYLSGAPESALGLAGRLALQTGAAVVCARYRSAFRGQCHHLALAGREGGEIAR